MIAEYIVQALKDGYGPVSFTIAEIDGKPVIFCELSKMMYVDKERLDEVPMLDRSFVSPIYDINDATRLELNFVRALHAPVPERKEVGP